MLLYHHCTSLENVVYGEIKSNKKYAEKEFKKAYLWLEKEVNFYPTFLAVGAVRNVLMMTGYQNQWRRLWSYDYIGRNKLNKEYIEKGKFHNWILFSFSSVDGIFMDYEHWYSVLNAEDINYQIPNHEKRLIFKKSWSKSKWLRKAKDSPPSVQLVAPNLDLRLSERVLVRNNNTKDFLASMGFTNIHVKRVPIGVSLV